MRGDVVLQTPTGWLRFSRPTAVLSAHTPDQVRAHVAAVEAALARGQYAAGFIAYEAAAAFDDAKRTRPPQPDLPLLWFGLYDRAEPIAAPQEAVGPEPPIDLAWTPTTSWTPTISWPEYERAIEAIHQHIARGETYQVNYTYRLRAPFQGEAWPFFVSLVRKQPHGYAAFIDTGRYSICSASPELFFSRAGDTLTSKPMKGTAARGRTLIEDRARMDWLQQSEKNRAENVMIVDMIRNDLGRIAEVGSVRVPELFAIERYPSVLQMTSTVTARSTAPLSEVLSALFPCASITGAPKIRTMQIIAELETTPRGVYTGGIGYGAPDRTLQFNVAIRTVTIDHERGQAEYGVGGGIVWDSDAADEFRECEIKTRVLTQPVRTFDLLEAIRWTPVDGYFLLERHLTRLSASAEYFNRPIDLPAIQRQLLAVSAAFPPEPHKVRISVAHGGQVSIDAVPLRALPLPTPLRVALATQPVDAGQVFLYHKTTQREVYTAARATRPDVDEVILWNERGEITEATIANVVVELEGARYTPPVDCGLLPGTLRADLLERGIIQERVILKEELLTARQVWLINSVRGWLEVQFAMTAQC